MESELYAKLESLSTPLHQIAAKYATSEVDAQDIYQCIIEKALKTCSPSDTKSYICQLATWTARNMANSERIYLRYVTVIDDRESDDEEALDFAEIFADSSAPTPEDMLIENEACAEFRRNLVHVFNRLDTTNQRIVLMLARKVTHDRIADSLDITRTAVSNRVRKLRGIFQMAGLTPAMLTA
jgi:RNA polymerase sigma factor (sigma-70 family)